MSSRASGGSPVCGTLASMAAAKRHPEVPWLTLAPTVQALLDQGEATHGLTARTRGQHVIVSRSDEIGPDPRFRLTHSEEVDTACHCTNAIVGSRCPTKAACRKWLRS